MSFFLQKSNVTLFKVLAFYKDKDTMVDLKSQYNADLRFVDKIGKSLASKFPQVTNFIP